MTTAAKTSEAGAWIQRIVIGSILAGCIALGWGNVWHLIGQALLSLGAVLLLAADYVWDLLSWSFVVGAFMVAAVLRAYHHLSDKLDTLLEEQRLNAQRLKVLVRAHVNETLELED